mmetsp:Transcript_17175/g.42466  ORF Transcript_17175/g.42466 Transcript_17175/m.42466 type:complete len:298 (-) Transcript_17175:2076-2969(-)
MEPPSVFLLPLLPLLLTVCPRCTPLRTHLLFPRSPLVLLLLRVELLDEVVQRRLQRPFCNLPELGIRLRLADLRVVQPSLIRGLLLPLLLLRRRYGLCRHHRHRPSPYSAISCNKGSSGVSGVDGRGSGVGGFGTHGGGGGGSTAHPSTPPPPPRLHVVRNSLLLKRVESPADCRVAERVVQQCGDDVGGVISVEVRRELGGDRGGAEGGNKETVGRRRAVLLAVLDLRRRTALHPQRQGHVAGRQRQRRHQVQVLEGSRYRQVGVARSRRHRCRVHNRHALLRREPREHPICAAPM